MQALDEAAETMAPTQQKPPCLSGLTYNIKALRYLWKMLHEKYKFSHLCTNKANQDPAENQFSYIRRACGSNDTPNAEQFGVALKYSMLKKTLQLSSNANCQPDNATPLIEDPEVEEIHHPHANEEKQELENSLVEDPFAQCKDFAYTLLEPLEVENTQPLDITELNALAYTIGYSISKLKHEACRQNLNRPNDSEADSDDELMFCRLKRVLVNSNFVIPNTIAMEIALLLKAACQQKFSNYVSQCRRSIKMRLKEYVDYTKYSAIICVACFDDLLNRMLNIIIKAEVAKLQQNVSKSRPKTVKMKGKVRRMGLILKSGPKRKINAKSIKMDKKRNAKLLKQVPESEAESAPLAATSENTERQMQLPAKTSSQAEQIKAIEALEKLVASFPTPRTIQIEEKYLSSSNLITYIYYSPINFRNCFLLSKDDILKTYPHYEQELSSLFNRFKSFPPRHFRRFDLVDWGSVCGIFTEDQQYCMSLFLDEQLVPDTEKGMVI